jgi:hypothetical protein
MNDSRATTMRIAYVLHDPWSSDHTRKGERWEDFMDRVYATCDDIASREGCELITMRRQTVNASGRDSTRFEILYRKPL